MALKVAEMKVTNFRNDFFFMVETFQINQQKTNFYHSKPSSYSYSKIISGQPTGAVFHKIFSVKDIQNESPNQIENIIRTISLSSFRSF